MRKFFILFILLIFSMILILTIMGMKSTMEAIEYYNAEQMEQLIDQVNADLRKIYRQSENPEVLSGLETASENLDRATALISRQDVFKETVTKRLIINILILSSGCLICAALLWISISQLFLKPLKETIRFVNNSAQTDWQGTVSVKGFREIRGLQSSLNNMLSEIQESQKKLKNIERMNIGRFMAHQVRNSLTPIKLCSYNILQMTKDQPNLAENIEIVLQETKKIESLIQQFRTLTRFPELNLSEVDIGALLEAAVMGYPFVQYQKPEEQFIIKADQNFLLQAVTNILKNAVEASMESENPVTVTINPGRGFTVKDHGSGMSPETLDQIFKEDFTTKQQGMGIGLSFVKKVLDSHGFSISIRSAPGKGTEFEVITT